MDEKKMFGGVGYLIGGNMACGVSGQDLIVRVDKEESDALIGSEPGARRFDMTGRPMRGWILVAPDATADEADLERWVRRGERFAASLPPK
jgi:TfoX/Sxy family transcriptional regulator of competence genes